jgi:26S proteasome regulatory subunit N3
MPEAMDVDKPKDGKDKGGKDKEEAKKEEPAPPPPPLTLREELNAALVLVEKYVSSREQRFIANAMRLLPVLRRKVQAGPAKSVPTLVDTVSQALAPSNPTRKLLLTQLESLAATLPAEAEAGKDDPMEEDVPADKKAKEKRTMLPETEMYVGIVVLMLLIDSKATDAALACSKVLFERLGSWNRRTLDALSEKVFFYTSWAHERAGLLDTMRSPLLAAYRTACLHHNTPGVAQLLNLLLRNYLHYKMVEQADKLLAKATFPETAPNSQLARFLYYNGRIKALQLEYSDAHRCLLQATRKAPQTTGRKALGFRLAVHKLSAIVQLLLGAIPERAFFREPASKGPMRPYLQLVQAVRLGDLAAFRTAMEAHAALFTADGNMALVTRLRQNVIRAGLRNISLSYSRIALKDVAVKLALDHPEDMESIAAKAIRDGVLDATIDHASGVLISKEQGDVYATLEPGAAFHKRITFCLNLHNDAVKAMSYPFDAHKDQLPDAETVKERQREEQELAQSLAEEDDDDF